MTYELINVDDTDYLVIDLTNVQIGSWSVGDDGHFVRLCTNSPVGSDELELVIKEPNPVSNIVPRLLEVKRVPHFKG